MFYMVQHAFSRPDMERDWNDWYAANLPILHQVGFRTLQRFRAVGGQTPPRYMAMYTVDSADIFESAAYRNSGGGGASSARFRPAYQVWIRNLFEAEVAAPAVADDQAILVLDADKPGDFPPASWRPLWIRSSGHFHDSTPWRALAVRPAAEAEKAAGGGEWYRPLAPQLK